MARISLRMSLMNVLFFCLLILLFPESVNSRWCTRLKSEKQVHTFIEPAQCNQSYQAACGWFTRKQCTFYELVECPKERNHTVVRYKIIEECCPGYKLDPINNITCLRDKDEELGKEEVTPGYSIVTEADLSPLVGKDDLPEANLTKNISRVATGNEDAIHYLESDDGLFLGLSHGAYAGIICSLLFVLCVCILIALHVYKKKQKDRLKASNQAMEMGVTEKMMPQVNT